jgi:hypothetical protein
MKPEGPEPVLTARRVNHGSTEEPAMYRNSKTGVLLFSASSLVAAAAILVACEREGPAEQAGKKIDNAAKDTGKAIEDAGKKVQDATKK